MTRVEIITTIVDQNVGTKDEQTETDSTVQMEYDSVNRLIKYNGKEVKYDADGNMIYGPLDGEMATFTYDCRNRLIEVVTDSGEMTQYAYDAENVRTKVNKNVGTAEETITTYVTDSVSNELSRVLEATTVDKEGNTETIRYTYGNGLIAQEKSKDTEERENSAQTEYLLYHFNHLGSTTAVTDEVGTIKYSYTYNIFGKLLSGNYGEVEYLYNGQYGVTSDDNGLYYMRARYYSIDIMRFINQDILTGSIDSSQSLNRYAYVEGNPVNFLDPFGLCVVKVDTSGWHTVLGVLGIGAFAIGALATSATVVMIALLAGVAISGLDAGIYLNDVIEAESEEERIDALQSSALSVITIGTGTTSFAASAKYGAAATANIKELLAFLVDAFANYMSAK